MRSLFELFFCFVKMGCVTFGGGYSMLPIIKHEIIEKRGWASMEELLRYYTIAQITPGVIAVNLSTFVGHKRLGTAGGIAATLGFTLPSATMAMIAAVFLSNFSEIPLVHHAFNGIKLAVGALVLDTTLKFLKGVGAFKLTQESAAAQEDKNLKKIFWTDAVLLCVRIVICAASFLISYIYKTNPVFIVSTAALIGFLFSFLKQH